VPNALERGPALITGACVALDLVPKGILCVCASCLSRPPYFGLWDPGWEPVRLRLMRFAHPGWCMLCRAWMGDDFAIVAARPPVVDLVASLLGPLAG
jgi:hypothetical protein